MGTLWYETIMAYLYDRESFLANQEGLLHIPEPTVAPTDMPTSQPTVSPTAAPTGQPTVNPTVAPTSQPKGTVFAKGKKYHIQGLTYQVTKTGKSNAVQLVKASAAVKNKKNVTVPDKVKVNGVSCLVTSVGKNVSRIER